MMAGCHLPDFDKQATVPVDPFSDACRQQEYNVGAVKTCAIMTCNGSATGFEDSRPAGSVRRVACGSRSHTLAAATRRIGTPKGVTC